jgi:SH3-like domain-containing protein
MIDKEETIRRVGYPLSSEAVVRQGRHIRYPIVKQFNTQDLQDDSSKMYVFEEYDEWYKVRTAEGIIGYIGKRML